MIDSAIDGYGGGGGGASGELGWVVSVRTRSVAERVSVEPGEVVCKFSLFRALVVRLYARLRFRATDLPL